MENLKDDNMTVFTVPCNKPFVLTKAEAEQLGLLTRRTPLTKEQRAEIKRKADRLLTKPEKKQNEQRN